MDPIDRILQARTARELFAGADAEILYKKLQRQVHPDLNQTRLADATAAFVRLNELYKKLSTGNATTFTTKKATWTVLDDVWRASGVRYRAVDKTEDTWVAYVATTQATGPFVEGHRNLENLTKDLLEDDQLNGTTHRYFFPRVMDKFKLGDQKKEARVLSAELPDTRWFPLSSWTSIDPKDIAWIARRVLIALDLVHSKGFVHGSPHLEAIIIEPAQHGVMLKDWQYSVRKGDPIQLIDPQAKDAYPTWVKDVDSTKDARIDLMVVGHAFEKLSKASAAPPWMEEFFHELRVNPPKKAVYALEKLTKLLDEKWERRFHPMSYPK